MTPPASFSETTYDPDRLIAGEADDLVSEKVTIAAGADLTRGAILGKITASGKYALCDKAAVDGSENPVAVLAEDAAAASADAEGLIYLAGQFNESAITLAAGTAVADVKDALRDLNIYLIAVQGA